MQFSDDTIQNLTETNISNLKKLKEYQGQVNSAVIQSIPQIQLPDAALKAIDASNICSLNEPKEYSLQILSENQDYDVRSINPEHENYTQDPFDDESESEDDAFRRCDLRDVEGSDLTIDGVSEDIANIASIVQNAKCSKCYK